MDDNGNEQQQELYEAKLQGLAESKLAGKTARQVQQDLTAIAGEFETRYSEVNADFKDVLKRLKQQPDQGDSKPADNALPEYLPEAIERGEQICNCRDQSEVFHNDFNRTGYIADRTTTKAAHLIFGSGLVNFRSLGRNRNSICGIQTGVVGHSAVGKSAFVNQAANFVDCSRDRKRNRIKELSDCSDFYLAFAGGDNGDGLADKLILWDEIPAPPTGEYTQPMHIMWQTTTKGDYIRGSTVEGPGGKRIAVEYILRGTLRHMFTSTDPPGAFETQFSNRTIWIEIDHSQDTLAEIAIKKLLGGKGEAV